MNRLFALLAFALMLSFASASTLQIDFYHQVGCSACAVFEKTLEEAQSEGNYQLNVSKFEIRYVPANMERFKLETARLGIKESEWATPTVVINGSMYFIGAISKQEFYSKLDNCLAGGCTAQDVKPPPVDNALLSPLALFTFGLISGFNPCLFAVLLFLITYSLGMSENKMRLVKLTVSFSFGIFAAYFLIGWGLLSFAGVLDLKLASLFIAGLVIILGAWTIKDYKNPKSLLVETPENIKGMSESLTRKNSVATAFLLGGLFSLVKAPCVGGIYLSVLNMASSADMAVKINAIPLLVSYNLGLVFPLLIISGAVLLGVPPNKIEEWREKNKFKMRIFLGVALILVGLIMLWQAGVLPL
jgi:cytochrome c biogenesis protein CcdA